MIVKVTLNLNRLKGQIETRITDYLDLQYICFLIFSSMGHDVRAFHASVSVKTQVPFPN